MKNILFWLALVVLILGFICLHVRYTRGSNENGNPVNLPFPGAGLSVAYPFYIENEGKFEIRLSVPILEDVPLGGIPQKLPIKSKIKVTIRSLYEENNFKNTQYIEEFWNYGNSESLRVNLFRGATIELPRKGDYKIEIVNEDYDGILDNCSKTGGMIKLVRDEKLETGLFYALLNIFGYACITISLIGMVIIRILENRKK